MGAYTSIPKVPHQLSSLSDSQLAWPPKCLKTLIGRGRCRPREASIIIVGGRCEGRGKGIGSCSHYKNDISSLTCGLTRTVVSHRESCKGATAATSKLVQTSGRLCAIHHHHLRLCLSTPYQSSTHPSIHHHPWREARSSSAASRTPSTGRSPSASAARGSSRRPGSSPCSATPTSASSSSPHTASSTTSPPPGMTS